MTVSQNEVRAYYNQLTAVDIGEVARELLGDRITGESGGVLSLNCPMHASISPVSTTTPAQASAIIHSGVPARDRSPAITGRLFIRLSLSENSPIRTPQKHRKP